MMWKYNIRRQQIILHLKNYLKSEEFIFDVAILSFISIFDYIVPHSRDKLLNLLQHRPINEFIVSMSIQFMIMFNIGRLIQRISDSTTFLEGLLTIISYSFVFFLYIFPAFFIEHIKEGWFCIVIALILGVFVIFYGMNYGIEYEEKLINSKKRNKKRIKILIKIFLTALSYSALMLYQALMMQEIGIYGFSKSVVWILVAIIITGILPFRILLLIERPINFFGVFVGITILFINIFTSL